MRYPSGSIALSEARDLPLLHYVLQAGLITPAQLFELLQLERLERSKRAFYNRLKRLLSAGFLETQLLVLSGAPTGYTITDFGIKQLVSAGELLSGNIEPLIESRIPAHWVCMNQLRIVLRRSELLQRWLSPAEIRWYRHFHFSAFSFDYDAVVTISTERGGVQLGLIYESELRTPEQYCAIQSQLEKDGQVQWILYLTTGDQASRWLSRQLDSVPQCVAITSMEEFQRQLLRAGAYIVGAGRPSALDSVLRERAQPSLRF